MDPFDPKEYNPLAQCFARPLREPKIYGLTINLLRPTVLSWLARIQPPIPSPSQLGSHCLFRSEDQPFALTKD